MTEGFTPGRLGDPGAVSLINYGTIGTNLFEEFDRAYCLGGFYINESVLGTSLQGMVRRDIRVPMKIATGGVPRRRRVEVDPGDRFTDVARIATPTLRHRENGTVLQAVGRVKPFTSPREVITFQMGELPGVEYDYEFQNLAEARVYFGIQTRRGRELESRSEQIAALRRVGMPQAEVARALGITEKTVGNHEKKGGNRKSSIPKK